MENTTVTSANITLEELEQYAVALLEKETEALNNMIQLVADNITVTRAENGGLKTNLGLGATELEALVMKIPAECLRLQSVMNMYNTRNTFKDIAIDGKVAQALADLQGTKGTAEERKKKAEMTCIDEKSLNQVNKMMIRGIQGSIERADKVYEGIKKVLDFRGKEGWYDRKGQR